MSLNIYETDRNLWILDKLSIWDLALQLGGDDPYKRGQNNAGTRSKDAMRFLLSEVENNNLAVLQRIKGGFSPIQFASIEEFDEFIKSLGHQGKDFLITGEFNEAKLRTIFIGRGEFLRYCLVNIRTFPSFWASVEELNIEFDRLYPDFDKNLMEEIQDITDDPVEKPNKTHPSARIAIACQVVAQQLWKAHPELSISEMIKRDEIQHLCGARNYQGAHTVRNWIKEFAPADKRKPGRPKGNG